MSATIERNLSRLTWQEIAALDLEHGALVVPFGSLEQHGPHLSVDCDLVFTDRFLDMALEKLSPDTKVWRLPVFPISKSNEHVGFPGTFWLSAQTIMAVLNDIAASAAKSGFKRLILWTCHGGNRALFELMARDIHISTGMMTFNIFAPAAAEDPLEPVDPKEPEYGIHGGDWETSLMLALSPDRVRQDKLNCEYPQFDSKTLALENAGATIGWKTSDFQCSGTWGDATKATAERGLSRLDPLIERLAAMLTEIADYPLQKD